MIQDTDLTLEEAHRFYWQEVPWVLDKDDLKIINKVRRDFMERRGTLAVHTTHLQDWFGIESPEVNIRKALWASAQRR